MIVVDRIENNIAVAYDGDVKIEIPAEFFYGAVKESDVITADENGKYHTDEIATKQRKDEIIERYRKFKLKGV